MISNVSVLLQEQSILRDLVGDIISWIFFVNNTIREIRSFSTLWWSFGVTITMMCWSIRGRMGRGIGGRVYRGIGSRVDCSMRSSGPDDCSRDNEKTCDLKDMRFLKRNF